MASKRFGDIYKRPDSSVWWIWYYDASGKRKRESTKTDDKDLARKKLLTRITEYQTLREGGKAVSDMPYAYFSEEFLKHYNARYPYETFKSHRSGYIPDASNKTKEPTNSSQSNHPFSKQNFQYQKEDDAYTCPEGKNLKYLRTKLRKDKKYKRKRVFIYEGAECPSCPSQSKCLGKGNASGIRHIERDGYEEYRARMKLKMQTEEGKKAYLKRNYTAEPPFGHLKHNLGYRNFLLRGLRGAKAEFALMCIGYNLIKICEFSKNWLFIT